MLVCIKVSVGVVLREMEEQVLVIIIAILTIRKPCLRQSSIDLNCDEDSGNSGILKTIVIEEISMERAKTP